MICLKPTGKINEKKSEKINSPGNKHSLSKIEAKTDFDFLKNLIRLLDAITVYEMQTRQLQLKLRNHMPLA